MGLLRVPPLLHPNNTLTRILALFNFSMEIRKTLETGVRFWDSLVFSYTSWKWFLSIANVKRVSILAVVAVQMMAGTFSISAYTTGYGGMQVDLNVSQEVLVVGQFTFLVGLGQWVTWRRSGGCFLTATAPGIGSLIWPPFGEVSFHFSMNSICLTKLKRNGVALWTTLCCDGNAHRLLSLLNRPCRCPKYWSVPFLVWFFKKISHLLLILFIP